MKLELKHLSPYLPYGLKVSPIHVLHHGTGIGSIDHILTTKSKLYKPRLRLLSDFTEEELSQLNYYNAPNFQYLRSMDHIWNYHKDNIADSNVEWCIMKDLFEWHFDVFGLIKADKAIDINTLNK